MTEYCLVCLQNMHIKNVIINLQTIGTFADMYVWIVCSQIENNLPHIPGHLCAYSKDSLQFAGVYIYFISSFIYFVFLEQSLIELKF